MAQLPLDENGKCMICETKPLKEAESITCNTCGTPWHVSCLSSPPPTLISTLHWECPDCAPASVDLVDLSTAAGNSKHVSDLVAAIRAIEDDDSLTHQEKAKKRQLLLSKGKGQVDDDDGDVSPDLKDQAVLNLLDENFNCSFCMKLPDRPVTTPCGHNFCLKCFQKWTVQGKKSCAKCRASIPPKMATQPRINSSLVVAIRMAKMSKSSTGRHGKVHQFVHDQQRPDKAFTTDRAKKAGKANACSGKIFVTVPPDHFGPILAENDPERKKGVLVGECWEDRMECRQWGAHLPHVAGIAGQSEYGAQSVALSGGYEDDEDNGEWFLYTGSGGRDLSGNKRTNKAQSFDQKFEKLNKALRVSCVKGYPVRVVRSHKEKRSSYAPEKGVRYDGVYRIEKCWRKVGVQGFKVCRYLFVRCDNEPAPWTSDEHGDRPRPLPDIEELNAATDITERKQGPSWDYDEEDSCWKWIKPPPLSKRQVDTGNSAAMKARKATRQASKLSLQERLLKEFSCSICRKVLNQPATTPCAHNFCKPCLEAAFSGQSFIRKRTYEGWRTLRAQKIKFKCPACSNDISDFLKDPQINRELMRVIESLQSKTEEENAEDLTEGGSVDEDEDEDEDQDDIQVVQGSPENKSKMVYERRKASNVSSSLKLGDAEKRVKTEAVSVAMEEKDVMEAENSTQKSESENTMEVESERKEETDSPSSPLHVGSAGEE